MRRLGDVRAVRGERALLALPEPLQAVDRGAWTLAYRAVGQEEYPHIWRVRDELPLVTDDAIFEAVLAIVITGLCERAAAVHLRRPPRRCRGRIKVLLTAISEVIHGTCGWTVHKPVDRHRIMRITRHLLWIICGR